MHDSMIQVAHRRAIEDLITAGGERDTQIEHVQVLNAGYSDASVYLVWARTFDPLVIKVAGLEATRREKEGRDHGYDGNHRLTELHLDHMSNPFVDKDGVAQYALAYWWEGGVNYEEMSQRIGFTEYLNRFRGQPVLRDSLMEVFKGVLYSIDTEHDQSIAVTPPPS